MDGYQLKYRMTQENRHMTFNFFVKNAQAIFDGFPNEQVWIQSGLRPNRQLRKPEAGYCIVIRYDEKTTSTISHFMTKIRSVLPPIVAYSEQNLHTTVGTYGKGDMKGFIPDSATLQHLMKSVEKGINNHPQNLHVISFQFPRQQVMLSVSVMRTRPTYPRVELGLL